MRRFAYLGAAALVAFVTIGLAAPTAFAAAPGNGAVPDAIIDHSCGPGYDANRASGPFTVLQLTLGNGAVVQLRGGHLDSPSGQAIFWGRIVHAEPTSQIWLDWADHSTTNFHRCGPVTVHTCCDNHTPAVNWVDDGNLGRSGRFFRAGGVSFTDSGSTAWHANVIPG